MLFNRFLRPARLNRIEIFLRLGAAEARAVGLGLRSGILPLGMFSGFMEIDQVAHHDGVPMTADKNKAVIVAVFFGHGVDSNWF